MESEDQNGPRREFVKKVLGFSVLAASWSLILAACGSSSSTSGGGATTPTTGGDCEANGTSVSIGANHGHTAPTISASDVTTGTQQAYILGLGTAGHSHGLTITAADFTTLQGNTGVTVTSDVAVGHTHDVTIDCA